MQQMILDSKDKYQLSVRIYEPDNPIGVIRIIHGMTEHQGRYEDFAKYLTDQGYIAVTSDLRGHGDNAPMLSHIADKDGHKRLLDDETVIRDYIMHAYPNMPMILFGHSMGSIIARKLLQDDSSLYKKAILSGYVRPQPESSFGILLTRIIGLFRTPKGRSPLLTALSIGPFAKAIPNAKPSDMKWISYNEDNIARFKSDPLCGREFTIGSYNALFHLVNDMSKPSLYRNVNKDLPILLISGQDDPCTGFDKGRQRSLNVLRRAGFSNITVEKMPNMRHEILNETKHEDVYKIIGDFIKS